MSRPRKYDVGLRSRLIDEARSELATVGFAAMSMRAITGRAGTSANAVYALFGSKALLVDEVVSQVLGERLVRWKALSAGQPGEDAVSAMVADLAQWAHCEPWMYRACFTSRENDGLRRAGIPDEQLSGDLALGSFFVDLIEGSSADALVGSAWVLWALVRGFVEVRESAPNLDQLGFDRLSDCRSLLGAVLSDFRTVGSTC